MPIYGQWFETNIFYDSLQLANEHISADFDTRKSNGVAEL